MIISNRRLFVIFLLINYIKHLLSIILTSQCIRLCMSFLRKILSLYGVHIIFSILFLGKSRDNKLHSFILALSCIYMVVVAPISAQDFQKGLEAYNKTDFDTALKNGNLSLSGETAERNSTLVSCMTMVKAFLGIMRRPQNGAH